MRFVFCLFSVFVFFISSVAANVRAGAPRPLQSAGAFIVGTHVQIDGANLNFVRTQNARPALWRAAADGINAKTPDWSTLPHREQSPYLLEVLSSQRTLSPDGKRLAYVSRRGGLEAIYVVPFEDIGREERARRVVTLARNPAWLDASTLLYENTRPGRSGLFRIAVSEDEAARPAPQQLFPRGGETTVSPDGQTICLAALSDDNKATQLYLLASDGSGAQAIPQTEGARRPAFASHFKAIFYDAPAPHQQEFAALDGDARRVLWMIPLQAKPPTAQLAFVRAAANGDAEIVGTLFSGEVGELQSRLEFWPGDESALSTRARFTLPVKNAPIHNGVLVRWPLPRQEANAPREWTLRLTAEDASGETSSSTLTFRWPPPATVEAPSLFGQPTLQVQKSPELPATNATLPGTPAAVSPVIGTPPVKPVLPAPAATAKSVQTPRANPSTPSRLAGPLTSLPAPALPTAPPDEDEKSPAAAPPDKAPAAAVRPAPIVRPVPLVDEPIKNLGQPAQANSPRKPVSQKPPAQKPQPQKPQAPKPPSSTGGIPSQMKARSSTPVAVTLRNTGSRSWSSTGEAPVRLIIRWINADTNTRTRWSVKWLGKTVPPGGSTVVKFDLEAPPTPGRYILTYALVRLNDQIYDGKNYKPPSLKSADQRWPGEFGAVSFEIKVVS